MFRIEKSICKIAAFLSLLTGFSSISLKSYTITGNVKDIHTGSNIENAEVVVQDYNDSTRIETAYTDANGDFFLEWSFNQAPNTPVNVSPSNGAAGVSLNPELKVIGMDQDNDSLDIGFYKALNDSLIDSVEIASNDTASVVWDSLESSTLYEWFVKVTDGLDTTQSPVWNFTTESNGGIPEEDAENIRIYGEGSSLKVSGSSMDEFDGDIYDINGRHVGELTKIGSEYGFSASGLAQGNYFMILKKDEENIGRVKFSVLNDNVFGVSPKWNIEEDDVSSTSSYKRETSSLSKRAKSLSSERSDLDSLEFTFNHSDFWQRITYRLVDLADDTTNIYETMITNDTTIFNIDCFEEMTWRQNLGGLRKWGKDAVIAVDTTGFNQSTIELTLNNAPAAANALTKGTVSGDYVSLMNRHGGLSQDTIWVYYDPGTPGGGGGSVSGDPDVYNAGTMHLNNTVTAEYVWNEMGGALELHDTNKKQSVMNDPPQYAHLTPHDSLVVEFMYGNDEFGFPGRPVRNKNPDEDPVPEGWQL